MTTDRRAWASSPGEVPIVSPVASDGPGYDLLPHYGPVAGSVAAGYERLVDDVATHCPGVLAIDGPAALDWAVLVDELLVRLRRAGVRAGGLDVRDRLLPWAEIKRRTEQHPLRGDPEFAPLCPLSLADLFHAYRGPSQPEDADMTLLWGPGAALHHHDRLWYAALPKRLAPAAIDKGAPNIGQRPGQRGTKRRLQFVDWPVEDRHAGSLMNRVDLYVDATDPRGPRALGGDALRLTLRALARGPFRTRPVFLAGAWGGQWLRKTFGVPTDAPNLAWSYELIAPESGVLLGESSSDLVEVGFELLMAAAGADVLGPDVAAHFGSSFPIRFDYLDTFDGGNLSVHCHPRDAYMREMFGWPYTQHESYYVMATSPGAEIFLGLREDAWVKAFERDARRAAEEAEAFDIGRYVDRVPAQPHQLYLIPAGTPHGSSAGNVVLEISSTPYLYSLRFYDWLRADLEGGLRPVHMNHAFANLDPDRRGARVRNDLVPAPKLVRHRPGMAEYVIGRHPDLFFAVHRLDFDERADSHTEGRFHVLNLVEGQQVYVVTSRGHRHRLAYGETLVVPAAAGAYEVIRDRGGPCKVVKAFVADGSAGGRP